MKVTLFTSNQPRHINLANLLAKNFSKVFTVIESNTIFPGEVDDFYSNSEVMKAYFNKVIAAEKIVFNNSTFLKNNISCLPIKMSDLNKCVFEQLEIALDSDIYIIFGASYIKGWLADHLIKNKAINIHMGLSPYYRGSSCNFWALYDSNPNFVGATIHMLSKGLDNGEILFHSTPEYNNETPYIFNMKAVKKAHEDLIYKIKTKDIFKMKSMKQNKKYELRYSRYIDFNDKVAKEFMDRDLKSEDIKSIIKKSIQPKLYNKNAK
jgi:methionyl-tRNA formyltransferase